MNVRDELDRCIALEYNRDDINKVITFCHKLAFSNLKRKAASNKFFMIRNENIEDLAWDFIAELFQMDDERNLIVLQNYFSSMDLKSMSKQDLHIELRKLVFTKVDDNIYRFFGKKDSSLKKIIRNIKVAIRNRQSVKEVSYRNGYFIILPESDWKKPLMPPDFLLSKLCLHLKGYMQIPEILIEVREIIDRQHEYRKQFPLVSLAVVIRKYFIILQENENQQDEGYGIIDGLLNNEFDQFLENAVTKVKDNVGERYVKKGKVKIEEIDLYFKAASDIVKADYYNIHGFSQYEHLNKYIKDLDYEMFRAKQRPSLEYLVKLIREELVDSFKKEWKLLNQNREHFTG